RLIISHNCVKNLVIENCPQLDQSLFYHYKSSDETRAAPSDAREYNEEADNPIKQQEQEAQFQKEQQERKKLEEQFIQGLLDLIEKAENFLNQGDQDKAQLHLTQIKQYVARHYPNEQVMARIKQLEQRINSVTTTSESESIPTKLIIGSLVVSCLVIGIIF